MSLREEIFDFDDSEYATVEVPTWKRSVRIKAFSAAERDAWEQAAILANKSGKPVENFRAKLAVLIVVDDLGNKVFTDKDVDTLGKKSGKALDAIFDGFLKLNKLTTEDIAELEKK